jgi:hypothetical protein
VANFLLGVDTTDRRLKAGSRLILRDYLAGFREAVLKAELEVIRANWRTFLDRGREVILARVLSGLESELYEPADEELAVSCVDHAHEAMVEAFGRIGSYEFVGAEGFIATLKLHSVLALINRMEIYGPWEIGEPIQSPPIRLLFAAPRTARPMSVAKG